MRYKYQVVGTFPDGSRKHFKVLATEREAYDVIWRMTQGCSPCARKSYGELTVEKVPIIEGDIL